MWCVPHMKSCEYLRPVVRNANDTDLGLLYILYICLNFFCRKVFMYVHVHKSKCLLVCQLGVWQKWVVLNFKVIEWLPSHSQNPISLIQEEAESQLKTTVSYMHLLLRPAKYTPSFFTILHVLLKQKISWCKTWGCCDSLLDWTQDVFLCK